MSKSCPHGFGIIKTDTNLIYWMGVDCRSGPHSWIFQCIYYGWNLCRACYVHRLICSMQHPTAALSQCVIISTYVPRIIDPTINLIGCSVYIEAWTYILLGMHFTSPVLAPVSFSFPSAIWIPSHQVKSEQSEYAT
jgi:hypothetical protein